MEKKSPLIIGIGELLWDMLPTGKKAGGAPVNLVYHATQLGADGYAISAIGKDELGEEILKARITDVYWNKQYILAKQCEFYNDSVRGYYIVKILPPVKKGVPYKKMGPLSEEEYIRLKKELGLDEKKMKHLNLFKNRIFWIW